MGIQPQQKLNQLQQILPEGLVVDSAWLQRHGYSRQLINKYVQNGWLESPARAVYRRAGAGLNRSALEQWEFLVISLQHLLNFDVTPGGRTALELQGLGHYLPLGGSAVHLFSRGALPGWVSEIPTTDRLVLHSKNLFKGSSSQLEFEVLASTKSGKLARREQQIHYTSKPWGAWNWNLIMSMPERAVLELLAEVPERETFEQADALFEGLTALSPKRLNVLLQQCRSVKAKRLFMWFSERHNHAWFDRLNRKSIDLGSGKRHLVPNGKLDKKYLITVPKEMSADG